MPTPQPSHVVLVPLFHGDIFWKPTGQQDKHRHKSSKSKKDGREEAAPEYGGRVTDAKNFAPVTKKVCGACGAVFRVSRLARLVAVAVLIVFLRNLLCTAVGLEGWGAVEWPRTTMGRSLRSTSI